MYSNTKFNSLAQVVITITIIIIIGATSTTGTNFFNKSAFLTDTTYTTTTTHTKTAIIMVEKKAMEETTTRTTVEVAVTLSDTSDVRLAKTKTTGSTHSKKNISFSANITSAAAANDSKTIADILKNRTITNSRIFTKQYTTKNTEVLSVSKPEAPTAATPKQKHPKPVTNLENTTNIKSTIDLYTIGNGVNTSIGISNLNVNNLLLDGQKQKNGVTERFVYVKLHHGGKNTGNLLTGSRFSRGSENIPVLQKHNRFSSGLSLFKNASEDKDSSGLRHPLPSASGSLSSTWRQKSLLHRRLVAKVEHHLLPAKDINDKKYYPGDVSDYPAFTPGKLHDKISVDSNREPGTYWKNVSVKHLIPLEALSKEYIVHGVNLRLKRITSFYDRRRKLNTLRIKQLNLMNDQYKKENKMIFLKNYKLGGNNYKKRTEKLPRQSDKHLQNMPKSYSNMKITSTVTPMIRGSNFRVDCLLFTRIKEKKKCRTYLQSRYRKKRKRPSLDNTVISLAKTGYMPSQNMHHEKMEFNLEGKKSSLSANISKNRDDFRLIDKEQGFDAMSPKTLRTVKRGDKIAEFGDSPNFFSYLSKGKNNFSIPIRYQSEAKTNDIKNRRDIDSDLVEQKHHDGLLLKDNLEKNSSNQSHTNFLQTKPKPLVEYEPTVFQTFSHLSRNLLSLEAKKEKHKRFNDPTKKNFKNEPFALKKQKLSYIKRNNSPKVINKDNMQKKHILKEGLLVAEEEYNPDLQGIYEPMPENTNEKTESIGKSSFESPIVRKNQVVPKFQERIAKSKSFRNLPFWKPKQDFLKDLHPLKGVEYLYEEFSSGDPEMITKNKKASKIIDDTNGFSKIEKSPQDFGIDEDFLRSKSSETRIGTEPQKRFEEMKTSSSLNQKKSVEILNNEKNNPQNYKIDQKLMLNRYYINDSDQNYSSWKNTDNLSDSDNESKLIYTEDSDDGYEDDDDEDDDDDDRFDENFILMDTNVNNQEKGKKENGFYHRENNFPKEKEQKVSWLKNVYESNSYIRSHDFFLDPESEVKILERKRQNRWRNPIPSKRGHIPEGSTNTEDPYLQENHFWHKYLSSLPIDLEHEMLKSQRGGRTRRDLSTKTNPTEVFEGRFSHRSVDEDDKKPCGNHGRHRRHVGGLHHLERHQRRDVHRTSREHRRFPRDVRFPSAPQTFPEDKFGKAAYFSGVRELLQLRTKRRMGLAKGMIPRQQFTIELWIKPEGGQSNPTVILGLFDMCHQKHRTKGWNIGIRTNEEGQDEDARIYFSLETDRANSPSVLMSDRTYEPNRWVHVAASYTGKKMKLYINTALVGVQNLQSGDIFSVSASSCKEIFLGGKPYSKEDLYRGSVDQILLWNFPLKHGDVVQNMFDSGINMDREKGIVFKESFDDLSQWKSFLKGQPQLRYSNIEDYRYDIHLVAPPCGKTVCDDPDVIRSYVKHSELRQEKRVRYRIVNVMDDNERNPKVTKMQTVAQHRALVSTFKQYNISWELEEVKLRNTSLRHKTVLLDCFPIQIGDKHCNRECQHTQTGNDGGDCDPDAIPCDALKLGNGRCDYECNRAYHDWDKGDCCQSPFKSANSTCLDPESPNRIYLSMNEYKAALNVNGSTHLNVYLASWSLKGLATFPWEKHVYDVLGGTVVDTDSFGQPGKMDGLIHEFGHNLGLWHVHHGVSEVKCDDPCMENTASLELGDLCSDTAPTAQNTHCRDPDWTVQACGISSFQNTPYRNYMSYASGNCTNHFTPQQVARMHCYLDLVYQPWQTTMKPSPVPLPPKVVAATLDSVTFVWLPGLGDNVYGSHSECHRCTQDGSLIQYASYARAPADSRRKLHWNKEEALGPPDAERCKASSLSWMQETFECKSKCYIEFMFKYHTVPQSISIWVVWKAAVGIKNVKFYFMDGSTDSLGPIRAFCDMPFTANLNYTKKVKKVRLYPNNTYVGIDAIQLVSTPESARICSSCRPTKYRVMRSPDFPRPVYTSETMYTDGSVIRGVNYSYTIQVNIGNKVSGPSPALNYQHGQPFCGNGRVETNLGEICDDGNVNDGDGCTTNCKVEKFYKCKGTPSLCYRHDGDGICEEDEHDISLQDCGYYTPEGYDDQWPITAIGNPRYQLAPKCSENVLVGAPTRFQVCKNNVELPGTWRPCNTNYFDIHDYWIKVYYAHPVIAVGVIIYLGSDGRTYDSPEPKSLLVQLIDTDDRITYIEHKLVISCQSNPIYISILHDLSRPFFRTKGIKVSLSSSNIAIAGIRLRASHHFDPITPESCSQEQFYNPRSQQCVNQTCPRKFCEQLITENAKTSCTGRGEGDTCKVTCLDGYRIRNDLDEVICADGVWRRAGEVSCVPVDCKWPSMVHSTFICPQGTTFKQSCSFRCNPPAELQGSGSMVTCEADGRWSMVDAYCLAFCHSLVEHTNAYPTSRSCQIEKAHQAGSRCKFRCEKGYHIEGMPAKRRSLHLTCKESGHWEGKKCVRVMCQKIPPEFTGMYTCSESTYGGSRCVLKCPTGQKVQKIKCLQKGVWSSHFKMCDFPKSAMCPPPQIIDHRIQIRNCKNRSAGSTCEVTCNSQAYQPALPHMNGTFFDSKDRVIKLTCTGKLRWLPNPRHINCKGTCRIISLKDGWCDSSNNRFFCAWDKGDCCASTVKGGKIRLDNPTCKSKCACKDPDAKENSNKSRK